MRQPDLCGKSQAWKKSSVYWSQGCAQAHSSCLSLPYAGTTSVCHMPGLSFPLSHHHILPWIGEHNYNTVSQICLFWTLPQSSRATLPTKYLVLFLQINCSSQLYRAHRQNLSLHLPRSFPSPGPQPQLTLSPPRLEPKVETETIPFLRSSSTTSNWLSECDKNASTN